MATVRWDYVLVDWVNCLKLSEPIKSLDDLADGFFFRSLLQEIYPEGVKEISDDVIISIFKFIKTNYPDYEFELEKSDLADLNRHDFIVITSILMHYTCIIGQRNELIEPLCSKLTQNVQVNIRSFLEEFPSTVDRIKLEKYVAQAMDVEPLSNTPTLNYFRIRSRPMKSSPLEDFLKTPTSRSRVNNEIRKLKSALEMEKFEKADLQEELVSQQNQIKQIREQLQQKTEEITKLRSELVALENRDPPYYQKDGSEMLQRKYQSEIQDLELYISQLQVEQQKLQDERNLLKEKMKKSEVQFKAFQEKYFEAETQNESLKEKCKLQESEINNLQILCNELNAVVSEFKTRNDSISDADSSFVDNRLRHFDTGKSCEDLAHTVIDIQLQEANKENTELKTTLSELRTNEASLNNEIVKLKDKLTVMHEKCETSSTKIEELNQRMKELESEQNSLSKDLNLSNLKNEEYVREIEGLNSKLVKSEEENKLLKCLEVEYKVLQKDLAASIEKYTNTNFELEALQTKFANFDADIEKCLSKLEGTINSESSNKINLSNRYEAFNTLIETLNKNLLVDIENKNEMTKRIENLTEVSKRFEQEIGDLKAKENISLKEKECLSNSLKEAEKAAQILELEIQALQEKVDKLNKDNEECVEAIAVLEKELNLNFTPKDDKQIQNRLKIAVNYCIEDRNAKDLLIQSCHKEIEISNVNKTELEEKLKTFTSKSEELQKTLVELEKEKVNKVNELLAEINLNKDEIQRLENSLKQIQTESEEKLKEFNKLVKEKDDELTEKQTEITTLVKKIELINETVLKMEVTCSEKVLECDNLRSALDKEVEANSNLNKSVKEHQHNIESLNEELTTLKYQFELKEVNLNALKLENDEVQKGLNEAREINQALLQEVDGLKQVIGEKELQLNDCEKELDSVKNDLLTSNQSIKELNGSLADSLERNEEMKKEIKVLKGLKEQLQKKCADFQQNMEKVIMDLSGKNQNYEQFVEEMRSLQNEKELLIKELENKIETAQNDISELTTNNNLLIVNHNSALTQLEAEKSDLLQIIEDKSNKEVEYLEEIKMIKDELNTTIAKYTQSLESYHESKCDYEMQNKALNETLHELVEKLNNLDLEHKKALEELEANRKLIDELKNEKESVEKELLNKNEELDELHDKISDELDEKAKQEEECNKEIEIIQIELNATKKITEDLEQELMIYKEKCGKLLANEEINSEELNKLQLIKEQLEKEVTCSKKMCVELENKLTDAENRVLILEEQERNLLEKLDCLDTEFSEFKMQSTKMAEDHEQLRKDIERNNILIKQELQEEITRLNKEKEGLEKQVSSANEKIKQVEMELEKQVKEYENIVTGKEELLQKLNSKQEQYETNIGKLNKELGVLNQQLLAEQKKRKELIEEHGEKNTAVNIKLNDLENSVMKLKCANALLETGKEKLQNDHDKLKISIAKLEEVLENKESEFNDQINLKEFEISHMKNLVSSLENEARDKQLLIEELRSDLDLINTNFEILKQDKFTVQDSLTDLENTYKETMKKSKESYESKLNELTSSYDSLKSEHESKIKELTDVNKQLEKKSKQFDAKSEEIETLSRDFESLKFELETKTKLCDELTINNSYLENNVKKLVEEKQELTQHIQEKETNSESLQDKLNSQLSTIKELEINLQNDAKLMEEKANLIAKLENEKIVLKTKIDEISAELVEIQNSKETILKAQTDVLAETEANMLKIHENTKNGLLKRIEIIESERNHEEEVRVNLEKLLNEEKQVKEVLNLRIIELENEKSRMEQIHSELKYDIWKLSKLVQKKSEFTVNPEELGSNDDDCDNPVKELKTETVNLLLNEVENRIINIFTQNRELLNELKVLEVDRNEIENKILNVSKEREEILLEKAHLFEKYEALRLEKESFNKSENLEQVEQLESELANLKSLNLKKFNDYQELMKKAGEQRICLEKLVATKFSLEGAVNTLKENLLAHQIKTEHITESSHKILYEKKQVLEIIVEDLCKQYLRLSKQISNTQLSLMSNVEKTISQILSTNEKPIKFEFDVAAIEELSEKLENLKDQIDDALEQQKAFDGYLAKINIKPKESDTLRQKENVNIKPKEDDWKKKHFALKQRLTLAENAKNNFEKKLKQLREENKKLTERVSNGDNDQHYKLLLEQHLQTKEQYEKAKIEFNNDYKKLQQEFEEFKRHAMRNVKSMDDLNAVDTNKFKQELFEIRTAYGEILTEKSKYELEISSLRKIIDDRNSQLNELIVIKEAYEKLLEANNQLQTEMDTLKYKRARDREEFVRLLKKERDESENKESKKVQDIRMEYEEKLEKMKERMIKLYKEEVNKEMKKVVVEKDENIFLLQTISELKEDLKDARNKIQKLEKERNVAIEEKKQLENKQRHENLFSSRESLSSIASRDVGVRNKNGMPKCASYSSFEIPNPRKQISTSSLGRESISSRRPPVDDRKISTLPRTVIEEPTVTTTKHTKSVSSDIGKNFEMEDEGDFFNTKYLADLKEGKCVTSSSRESAASRMSELAFRNSLCPPHLKSSYPAETQFTSPAMFKEEDLKSGAIEFDDSMSSKLLPGERPRNRKDIGTTSYKKPGPPTPSKNAGRMSLESNSKQVLREHNDKTPKRTTPNRLKALFMGKNTSGRGDNSEVNSRKCQCYCHFVINPRKTANKRVQVTTESESSCIFKTFIKEIQVYSNHLAYIVAVFTGAYLYVSYFSGE